MSQDGLAHSTSVEWLTGQVAIGTGEGGTEAGREGGREGGRQGGRERGREGRKREVGREERERESGQSMAERRRMEEVEGGQGKLIHSLILHTPSTPV